MKATKLLFAAAIFTGLASLSFAGPGPDYWARTKKAEKDQAQAKAKAKAQAKADAQTKAAAQVAVCANCGCPDMKKS